MVVEGMSNIGSNNNIGGTNDVFRNTQNSLYNVLILNGDSVETEEEMSEGGSVKTEGEMSEGDSIELEEEMPEELKILIDRLNELDRVRIICGNLSPKLNQEYEWLKDKIRTLRNNESMIDNVVEGDVAKKKN